MAFDLNRLVRPNILKLKPYSSARSEFSGEAQVFLDANENAYGSPAGDDYNRYPDPLQKELKWLIAEMNSVAAERIFVGNGSDEAIDLLLRIFCEPGRDEAIICPPTYGMYKVSADINDVAIREVPLTADFELNVDAILAAQTERTKLLFLCSPNNPTGNLMHRASVDKLLEEFQGVVVLDEAYIDFAERQSMISNLESHPNLVVMQTFSKAWGMAGIRVGMAFADRAIVSLLNAVKPPYNISSIAQRAVIDALASRGRVQEWIDRTLEQRKRLVKGLAELGAVRKIYPTDANFMLVKMDDAKGIYRSLVAAGIVVRDRSSVALCGECLRITVGTEEENTRLLRALTESEKVRVTI